MISAGTLPRRVSFKVFPKNTSIYSYTTTSYLVQKKIDAKSNGKFLCNYARFFFELPPW